MTTAEPAPDPSAVVAAAVAEITGQPAAEVDPAATFAELGVDSLARVEIVVITEERCGIRIPDEVADGFETVGEVAAYVASVTG